MSNNINQNKRWLGWFLAFIIFIVLVVVFLLLWLLLSSEETYTTTKYESDKTMAIECKSSSITADKTFFDNQYAQSFEHIIKATFRNDGLEKITYSYDGVFSSDDAAETANAVLHADYNKYMASKSLNPDILKPTFSNTDNKIKISLIASADDLLNDNVIFFFLNMDDFQKIKTYTEKDFVEVYNSKGFFCKTYE